MVAVPSQGLGDLLGDQWRLMPAADQIEQAGIDPSQQDIVQREGTLFFRRECRLRSKDPLFEFDRWSSFQMIREPVEAGAEPYLAWVKAETAPRDAR